MEGSFKHTFNRWHCAPPLLQILASGTPRDSISWCSLQASGNLGFEMPWGLNYISWASWRIFIQWYFKDPYALLLRADYSCASGVVALSQGHSLTKAITSILFISPLPKYLLNHLIVLARTWKGSIEIFKLNRVSKHWKHRFIFFLKASFLSIHLLKYASIYSKWLQFF